MADKKLQLITVHNPFNRYDRDFSVIDYELGDTLLDLRNRYFQQDVPVIVSLNGKAVRQESLAFYYPVDGDQLLFVPEIQGGGGNGKEVLRTVAMIAVVAAVSVYMPEYVLAESGFWSAEGFGGMMVMGTTAVGGAMLVNAILPPPKPQLPTLGDNYGNSQVYGWNPQTTQSQGGVVPKFYGVNKLYGNIIAADVQTDESNSNTYLNALVCLGMGPYKRLYDFKLNDQVASDFRGVSIYTRHGDLDQEPIENFDYTPNSAWTADTSFSVGTCVRPSNTNGHIYKCTVAGKTGLTEPTWPTGADATVQEVVNLQGGMTFQQGSATVNGIDTKFMSEVAVGDYILAQASSVRYLVTDRASDTSLTIETPFGQTTEENVTGRRVGPLTWQEAGYDAGTKTEYPMSVKVYKPVWEASHAYTPGDVVVPATSNGHQYRCIAAGTSGSSEPSWPTGQNQSFTDGTGTLRWEEAGSDPRTHVYSTIGDAFDGLEVELSFPQGLWYANDKGGFDTVTVDVKVEIQKDGDSVWKNISQSASDPSNKFFGRWSAGYYLPHKEVTGYDSLGNPTYSAETLVWTEVEVGTSDPYAHTEGEVHRYIYQSEDKGVTSKWSWIDGNRLSAIDHLTYRRVSGNQTTPIKQTFKADNLLAGKYHIRVTSLTNDRTGSRYGDDMYLTKVSEVIYDDFTYPRHVLAGVRALATDQLSGSLRFSCMGDCAYVAVYDGIRWKLEASGNPAWVVWDILTQPVFKDSAIGKDRINIKVGDTDTDVIRYDGIDPARLDLMKFKEWADFCDDTVPSGNGSTVLHNGVNYFALVDHTADANSEPGVGSNWTYYWKVGGIGTTPWSLVTPYDKDSEKRITFNGGFDSESSMWEAAMQVCQVGRGILVWNGIHLTVAVDKAASPVQLFTVGNIGTDSFRMNYLPMEERATEIEIDFVNSENGYNRDKLTVFNDLASKSNKTSLQLFGITKSSEAWRAGQYRLALNQYLTRTVEFTADIDSIACTIGDVINVQHDIPQWGEGGRIVEATSNTVTLDKQIALDTGAQYSIMIRPANEEGEGGSPLFSRVIINDNWIKTHQYSVGDIVRPTTPNGYRYQCTVAGTSGESQPIWTNNPVEEVGGLKWEVFGSDNVFAVSSSFTPTPSQYDVYAFGKTAKVVKPFRISGISRTQEQKATITAVEYNESIYGIDYGRPALPTPNYSSLNPFPPVTDIVLDELLLAGKDGSLNDTINIYFKKPSDSAYGHAEIWYNVGGGWTHYGDTKPTEESFRIDNVEVDKTYQIAIVTVNQFGQKQGIDNSPQASILTRGKLDPPSNVTEFSYAIEGSGVKFTWNHIPDADLWAYEIRRGTSWNEGTKIVDGVVKNSYFWQPPQKTSGQVKFWIKAVDTSGIYSEEAISISFTITTPSVTWRPAQVTDNFVLLYWNGQPGTFPIKHFELRREGTSWNDAEIVGSLNGLFSTVFETSSGTYTYRIKAVDTAGLYSDEDTVSATVSQPPDYVLNAEDDDAFSGTKTNILEERLVQYHIVNEGLVTVTPGSNVVTGEDVSWLNDVSPGDTLQVTGDSEKYTILRVDNDKQITLTSNYTHAGGVRTNLTYSIGAQYIRKFYACANMSQKLYDVDGVPGYFSMLPGTTMQDFVDEAVALAGTASSNGTSVTGAGTSFDTALAVGSIIGNSVKGYRKVTAIETATALTVDSAWSTNLSNDIISRSLYLVEPMQTTASYEKVFDYGTTLGSAMITVSLTKDPSIGSLTVTPTISTATSLDQDQWNSYEGNWKVFTNNFRFVRVKLDFSAATGENIAILNNLRVKLDVKLKDDTGKGRFDIVSDLNGKVVRFTTDFVDISSITVSPKSPNGVAPIIPVYDFKDNYATTVSGCTTTQLNVTTGEGSEFQVNDWIRVSGGTGVEFTQVTGPDPITGDSFTVAPALTSAPPAGTSIYHAGFRVYLFNTNGEKVTGDFSWSASGY